MSNSTSSDALWWASLGDFTSTGFAEKNFAGTILEVNRAFCEMLGYTREELIGKNYRDITHPEDIAQTKQVIDDLVSGRETEVVWIKRYIKRDGELLFARKKVSILTREGSRGTLILQIENITEQIRIQEALEGYRVRYRSLFENSGTANMILDPRGRIIVCNQMAANLPELMGSPVSQEHLDAVTTNLESTTFESEFVLDSGTRWFHTTYSPILDERKVLVGILSVAMDVTEIRALRDRLQEAQRMEAIGLLASGIAHDFNNILTVLGANLDLAKRALQVGDVDEALSRLVRSEDVIGRAKSLAHQVLTYSKGGREAHEPTLLAPLIKKWAENTLSATDCTLELDVDPELRVCPCDTAQIAQVLENLLMNAVQVSAPQATVRVSARNSQAHDAHIEISVTDHGTGIPDSLKTRIFQPFFTTKPSGTGLGLATSRSIALQHGGELLVESEVGKGSTFTLVLPTVLEDHKRDTRSSF